MENIHISRFILAAGAILLALALWGAWGLWQDAGAHSIGWKWDTSSAIIVSNYSTRYGTQITGAVNDYNSNTDLAVNSCNTPCNESIRHIQKRVGNVDWAAGADSYSNGSQCNVDITCNETSNKVTYGRVVWNSASGTYSNSYAKAIARHEMGHIFGLAHVNCVTAEIDVAAFYSVMNILCSYPAPGFLRRHDIRDINGKY